ncbi:flocculation protein FLO11 [Oryzias melastigma]|uniref:flocculation protein FLO11 n=1 Tax=Oryzias melastigma TaxID=30732 RepID=UPI000CF7C0E1|nr:flocculation protein FLO11 [Oryzias melastigma]
MEKYRPLLCILFVTLSLGCIRTSAQNTTEGLSTTPAATVLPVSNGIVTTSDKNLALNVTHGSMAAGTNLSVATGSTQNVGAAITQSMAPGTNQSVTMSATKSVAVGTTQNVAPGATQSVALGTSQSMTVSATKSVAADTSHTVTMAATQSLATGPTQTMAPRANHTITMAATQSLATGPTQTMAPGTNHTITMAVTQSLGTGPTQTMAPGTNHTVTMAATQSLGTGPTQTMAPRTNHTVTMAATQSLGTGPTQTMAPGTNHTVTMAATQSLAPAPTQSAVLSSVQTVAAAVTQDILAGNNSTSQPSTTTALPVSPNITVETLPGNVSRNECRKTQLCAAEPSECDPSKDKSCFFLAAQRKTGQNFNFALSGQTDGYIAATVLTAANGKAVTYICANENKEVRFFSALLENDRLIFTNLSVNSVKGKVNGRTIQCTFLATVPDPLVSGTSRTRRATGITLSVSTGSYNATSSSVGTPTPVISTKVDNLTDINATLVNEISPNTTASPGENMTAFPVTTSSAAMVPLLQTDVSNTGCGSEKLCAAEPSSCNPASGGTCSFLSAKQKNGQIFFFELSGLSDGYIGSVFSPTAAQGNNDSAYVCANSNGAVKFITAVLNENALTETLLNVTSGSVKGKVNGRKIQCVFEATLPDTTNRAAGYSVSILSGTFNLSSGALGTPEILLRTNVVNLTDPTANITNLSNTNDTNSAVVLHHQPLTKVLLVPVGVLALTILGH